MCLATLDKEITVEKGTGYKVYCTARRRKKAYPIYRGGPQKTHTWIRDKRKLELQASSGEPYRTGYHVFLNLKDAKRLRRLRCPGESIRVVEFRDVVAQGIQWGAQTVVARQIKIGNVVR